MVQTHITHQLSPQMCPTLQVCLWCLGIQVQWHLGLAAKGVEEVMTSDVSCRQRELGLMTDALLPALYCLLSSSSI